LVASDCGFQPRVLPTGGWEAAVTGTLEACLYTAEVRWQPVRSFLSRTGALC
jgi:hypothetical protein